MNNNQKKYLCSFADTRLGISICRFKQQAENMNIFDDIIIYTEASLPLDFKEHFKDKMYTKPKTIASRPNSGPSVNHLGLVPSRGFGYWCWKPKVILMTLEQIQENSILIFCDIGMEFNASKRNELLDMIAQVDKNGIMGLIHNPLEKQYQKGDTLRYFNLERDEEFLNSKQLAAGMIFIKKTKKAQKIIQEWMDIFYEHFDFVNDEPSIVENPDFVRNLHDQSIWSIINKKYKCKNFPEEFYFDRKNRAILYNRNKTYLSNDVNKNILFNQILRGADFDNVHVEIFLNRFSALQKQITEKDSQLNAKNQELNLKIKELDSQSQQLTQTKKQLDIKIQELNSKAKELQTLKSKSDSKIKELESNLKASKDSIQSLNNTLNSLPIKKQTLEIKNLEQDLKIKELKTKQIEKELGYGYNVLEEIESLKQSIKVKDLELNKRDSRIKELESKSKSLESNQRDSKDSHEFKDSLFNSNLTAKNRIHNHLSYKLGKAMIENSKSLWGYIRMPYVLSYIKEQHNKEQKQYQEKIKKNPQAKLPQLESYPDYKEALKEKNTFTYKLGEAFIKANSAGGGGAIIPIQTSPCLLQVCKRSA